MVLPNASTEAPPPFWSLPTSGLLHALRATPEGLTSSDAAARLAAHGPNVLAPPRRRATLLAWFARFGNPLVLLLLVASAASGATGDVPSSVLIALVVIGSVTLDFVQERGAGHAADRLRDSVAILTSVLRDGQVQQLPTAGLVPGDIVLLAAGDRVPADGRVIEARDFFVQQALLTGESFPVEKRPADLDRPGSDLTAATNAAFMGSSVLSGSARLLVVRTGASSGLGDIAQSLRRPARPTAFEIGTRRFGQLIVQMTLALVVFVVLVNALFQRPLLETVLFAIALAVGLTPELLPMVVSVTLARGAMRMAERRVIVKRLPAIQNLGSMDVLCTDKTGTLTEARIHLERHIDLAGRDSARVLLLACLNSRFESGLRSPLDDAILAHEEVDLGGWRKLDEVPFGFERRRVSVLVERDGERLLVVKGAPEELLPLATRYETGDGAGATLDAPARARALAAFEALGREGFRVLAIAWRAVPAQHDHAVVDDETELVLCGYAAFVDPPKHGVDAALHALRRSGVSIKVLTGDNEAVTQFVCARVGQPARRILSGAQVDRLDDQALAVQARRADAFCRVSPAQKSRILRALRRGGHVVGFLGDGVNDAPSLHDADVGICVHTAVDVAREAADIVLLEQDLGVLHDGVIEGRRTYVNVMKYIMMATSSNFGNMFSMAFAALVLPFLPMLPVQVLLNNFLYDLSEVAIPLDRVDAEDLRRPHDWDPGFIRRFMFTLGPVSSVFDFATFYLLLTLFTAGETLFRTGWFIESVATQVLVIFVIRTRGLPWRSRPHRGLALSAAAVVLVALALPWSPFAAALGFTPVPPAVLGLVALLAAAYLAAAEVAKRAFFQRESRRKPRRLTWNKARREAAI